MGFLSLFSGFKVFAVVAVAMAAGMGILYLLWQNAAAEVETHKARYNELQTAHYSTLATLTKVNEDIIKSSDAVKKEIARRHIVERKNKELLKGIANAPVDGCVGPAVKSVIDGLLNASDHNKN